MSAASPSEGAGPPTIVGRRAYLQWSCDRLSAALEGENVGRANTRNQAHVCFLLIPALLVLVVSKDVPGGYVTFTAASRVVMFGAAVVALVYWYRVMVTRPVPGVQVTVFTRDDEPEHAATKHDYEHRLDRARNNLLDTVRAAQASGDELGRWRRNSLRATVATVVAAAAPYSLEPINLLLESIK
jgi:hypothetical protein